MPPDRHVYDLLGSRVVVVIPDPAARDTAWSILRGFEPEGDDASEPVAWYALTLGPDDAWQVRAGDGSLHSVADLPAALALLEWHLVTEALARRHDVVHLHGAALAVPGRDESLLVIGDSGCGKTTLTLGLMLRGFTPFGDDVILLEPDSLAARPVRRAFHIEPGTRAILAALATPPTWRLDVAPAGYFWPPAWADTPRPARHVLFPELVPGARPCLTRLSPVEAAPLLLTQSGSLEHAPRQTLATVARLTAQAACHRLVAGDLTETVSLIAALTLAGAPELAGPAP